jgi:outer membrane protein assembly factor BamB
MSEPCDHIQLLEFTMTRLAWCLGAWLAMTSFLWSRDTGEEIVALCPDKSALVTIVDVAEFDPVTICQLVEVRDWTIFYQSSSPVQTLKVRQEAERRKLLGRKVIVGDGARKHIALSHNAADAVAVSKEATDQISEEEVMRVLRPNGKARFGDTELIKPIPSGMDDWSHPFHGPDNNTQSNDKLVRGEFQTQFIGFPMFSPMPEQTVIAGGRMYKAMGNIAHKANQNDMLNTLLCVNAYNGLILWKRALPPGFMIHRNTMVATDEGLYMGDHESCKLFDAITGELKDSIRIPSEITDGPVWKWMGMTDDTLYALVGNPEVEIRTIRSDRPGIGHWPWGMWDGHDYNDPRTAFGHGRTIVAIDRKTKAIKWHFRQDEFLDARAVCMMGNRLYAYAPERFLMCLDASSGTLLWKNQDKELLDTLGPNEKAQHYITGYATTTYMKCSDDQLFFAGPQRKRMVVASGEDGRLQWTHDVGNLQLVLRPDAIYAAGPENTRGYLLDYKTGGEIASMPARRACTRATGCADSIFFRATGGTIRIMTGQEPTNMKPSHIAPMRPPCQDGVLVSNGHLYWGPWMCGCQLSLYGNIGLRPKGDAQSDANAATNGEQLIRDPNWDKVQALASEPNDWTTFQATADRSSKSPVLIGNNASLRWDVQSVEGELPTAPIAVGDYVFVADRMGVVRAYHKNGKEQWRTYTGGPIFFSPAYSDNRIFVGSADGFVYALEAATGRVLWKRQVGENNFLIPVYGQLVSRWPVAGGVAVRDGQVYAAAGITHYDGTVVVALDAKSGEMLAENRTSGKLSDQIDCGISMQGELSLVGDELRFAGGGVYEVARYRSSDLVCLNDPRNELNAQYRTAFYAWYPQYNRFSSLETELADGRVLSFDANYDGTEFNPLCLENARPLGMHGKVQKDLAGEFLRRRGKNAEPTQIWRDEQRNRFTGFAVCGNALVATGHPSDEPDRHFLAAMNLETGKVLWRKDLAADAVKSGIAVGSDGSIYVTLTNGQLVAFSTN